jgi:hypothetical protein
LEEQAERTAAGLQSTPTLTQKRLLDLASEYDARIATCHEFCRMASREPPGLATRAVLRWFCEAESD